TGFQLLVSQLCDQLPVDDIEALVIIPVDMHWNTGSGRRIVDKGDQGPATHLLSGCGRSERTSFSDRGTNKKFPEMGNVSTFNAGFIRKRTVGVWLPRTFSSDSMAGSKPVPRQLLGCRDVLGGRGARLRRWYREAGSPGWLRSYGHRRSHR